MLGLIFIVFEIFVAQFQDTSILNHICGRLVLAMIGNVRFNFEGSMREAFKAVMTVLEWHGHGIDTIVTFQ